MRLLTLFLAVSALLSAEKPGVSECFKVNSLIRMDEEHYWANWTNRCSYTIDAVYVMVGFEDNARNPVGKGVWALHYVIPGDHRIIRFTTPASVSGYTSVKVRKITINSEEALH